MTAQSHTATQSTTTPSHKVAETLKNPTFFADILQVESAYTVDVSKLSLEQFRDRFSEIYSPFRTMLKDIQAIAAQMWMDLFHAKIMTASIETYNVMANINNALIDGDEEGIKRAFDCMQAHIVNLQPPPTSIFMGSEANSQQVEDAVREIKERGEMMKKNGIQC